MVLPSPISAPLATVIAERFRVIGDPMRIRMLDRLREQPSTVGELQSALGSSQQNVSKHLGILRRAGIVARARQGTAVRYSIADPSVFAICEIACGGIRQQIGELADVLDGTGTPTAPRTKETA